MKTSYCFSAGQAIDTDASTICRTAKQMGAPAAGLTVSATPERIKVNSADLQSSRKHL